MKKVKIFEEFLNEATIPKGMKKQEFTANHIECDNCGWTWMLQDGGEDI